MFDSGSAVVKPYMRELLRAIGSVLAEVPNRLTLEGHTDAQPFGGGDRGYSNWELSADRANASRRELMAGGLPEDRCCGCRAWRRAALRPERPASPANRRISIIVMNREAEERFFRTAPPARRAAAKPLPRPENAVVSSQPGADPPRTRNPINASVRNRPRGPP
jgi:chemotaxis protein MotB